MESAANAANGQVVLEEYLRQALVVQRSNRNAPPKVNLSIEPEVQGDVDCCEPAIKIGGKVRVQIKQL